MPKAKKTAEARESIGEWTPVQELTGWEDNPRNNSEAVPKVAESIKRFGFGSPVIARTADLMVIAGHTRLAAAISLGLETVPVRFLDLDPADAKLLALADNKLGEVAEWNEEKLSSEIRSLLEGGTEDLDLDLAGFSTSEIEDLFSAHLDIDVEPEEDPFATPPSADESVTFAFGEYRGRVSRSVFVSFAAEYEKQKRAADSTPMLSDVLKGWLNVS